MKKLNLFFILLFVLASINVSAQCVSSFTHSVNISNVSFTDNSTPTGFAKKWSWDFGDGSTSTIQHPTHTYTSPGTYNVCLAYNDSLTGCLDTSCDPVVITSSCNAIIVFNNSITNAICQQPNGSINISNVSGGTAPYTFNWSDASTNQNLQGVAANTYIVTITDALGCDTTGTFVIQNLDSNYTYTNNTPAIFQFTPAIVSGPAKSYFWTFGDGSNSTSIGPNHTYTQSNRYEVCLKIIGDSSITLCDYCDSIDVNLMPVGGIEVIAETNEITIHPNPTHDVSYISIDKNLNVQRIRVLNLNGQEIFNNTRTQNNTSIDLSPFKNGIYIIQVFTDELVFQKKILKQ